MSDKHTYPSQYGRGLIWHLDEAWDILDRIRPGVIPDDARSLLCGLISGTLSRVAENPQAAIDAWLAKRRK